MMTFRDIIDVRSPTTIVRDDLSYLAGLIDGEGVVGFHAHRNNYAFSIQIEITDKDTIDWLHKTFGGHIYFRPRRKQHYKDTWQWHMHGEKAIELYMKIYTFLQIKRIYDLEPTGGM